MVKKLMSRWNREKAEAIERARVFDVEEREDCLVLTKRLSPFLVEAKVSAVSAVIWMVGNWHIYQSPVNRGTWIGWVMLWMLVGPAFAFWPIRKAWKVRQGEAWIFNRKTCQLEHNNRIVLDLDHLKGVALMPATSENGPALLLLLRGAKTLTIDEYGKHEEQERVGQQIADFVGISFNPPYW